MAGQFQTPTAAPGIMPPQVPTSNQQQGSIPFGRAVGPTRRVAQESTSKTLTAAQQRVPVTISGTGYMSYMDLEMVVSGTGNASTNSVALAEDAPWAGFASITLDDGGPQMVNIGGYDLHLLNLYGGYSIGRYEGSSDAAVYSALSTGTGTGAGSGRFALRIPAAINDRDYWGILGNQDRATKYSLRSDIAPSTSFYTTAPSALPDVAINRYYGFVPVPGAQSATNQPQEQVPPQYGIVHYLMSGLSGEKPTIGQPVSHYVRNLSNAVRMFVLVLRSGTTTTPRAAAEAAMPTQIDVMIGTDVLFSESYQECRRRMYDRYGFDAPSGVLVYEFLDDFGRNVGYELGNKYVYLGNVSEMQFKITYPTAFGSSSSNSLTIITDSLYIPPNVQIY